MSEKPTIHTEASRSWWNGSAKTACGLTITKVTHWGWSWTTSLTCPSCKALKNARRK